MKFFRSNKFLQGADYFVIMSHPHMMHYFYHDLLFFQKGKTNCALSGYVCTKDEITIS